MTLVSLKSTKLFILPISSNGFLKYGYFNIGKKHGKYANETKFFKEGNTMRRRKIVFTKMLRQCLKNNWIFLLTQEKRNFFLPVSGFPRVNQLKFSVIYSSSIM